jgi:hypothetical protein
MGARPLFWLYQSSETDVTEMVRTVLYEAAIVRVFSVLKRWGLEVAKR